MGLKVGNDMKLYYNSGTNASPTWVEIQKVGDVTVPMSAGVAEVDLRESNWLLNLASKLSGGYEFSLANDIGGTVYDALRGFFIARTAKQFASVDGDIAVSGAEGFKAFGQFTDFPWSQPTQEMSSHDVVVSLSYTEESGSLVEPSWHSTP